MTSASNVSVANGLAITASACITASRSVWRWPLNTITGAMRGGRGRPEFGQHGQDGPLWQNQIQQHQRQGFTVGKPQRGETS
jgi:hypothetical protein